MIIGGFGFLRLSRFVGLGKYRSATPEEFSLTTQNFCMNLHQACMYSDASQMTIYMTRRTTIRWRIDFLDCIDVLRVTRVANFKSDNFNFDFKS